MFLLLIVARAEPLNIPGGSFRQGSDRVADESPVREVTLAGFRIDRTEVSVDEFEAFVKEGGYGERRWWSAEGWAWLQEHALGAGAEMRSSGRPASHPVIAVTWYEAEAYCSSKGGSLPTEAQWEHAACGDGGRRYAWGDSEDFGAAWFKEGKLGQITDVHTKPVTEEDPTLASPFGLVHTVGNVWEWTRDNYRNNAYVDLPAVDPIDSTASLWRTMRGGSYMNLPSYCTCTHREPARSDTVRLTTGFRCAYPA